MIKIPKREYRYYTKDEKSMRTDGIFQTVFSNTIYTDLLKDFLESILHNKIEELEVSSEKNTMITKVNNMRMRFDLYVVYDKNNHLDIEMQNKNCYNIIRRLETSTSAMYYDAHKKGKGNNRYYKDIKAIAIAILDYNEFKDGPYHEIARTIRLSNGKEISNDIEYHIIQMPKFFEQIKEIKTSEEAWIAYLSNQLNSEELEEVFKMNKNIRDVDKLAKAVLEDDELMSAIDREGLRRAKIEIDKAGMYNHGIEVGEQKSKIETAKKMLEIGYELEDIIKITGLSREEIEKLVKC